MGKLSEITMIKDKVLLKVATKNKLLSMITSNTKATNTNNNILANRVKEKITPTGT